MKQPVHIFFNVKTILDILYPLGMEALVEILGGKKYSLKNIWASNL